MKNFEAFSGLDSMVRIEGTCVSEIPVSQIGLVGCLFPKVMFWSW